MTYQPSPEEISQAQAAIPQIEEVLARFYAPQGQQERDWLASGDLLNVARQRARLLHTLILGELEAVTAAGETALAAFIAVPHVRTQIIGSFDRCRQLAPLRDGLSLGAHNADSHLRLALVLFGEAIESAE